MPNISAAVISTMLGIEICVKAPEYSARPKSACSPLSSSRILPKPICGSGTPVTFAETATAGIR